MRTAKEPKFKVGDVVDIVGLERQGFGQKNLPITQVITTHLAAHGRYAYALEGVSNSFWEEFLRLSEGTPAPTSTGCTCEITSLLAYGCRCGQMAREKKLC